jgi:hypothetical protein
VAAQVGLGLADRFGALRAARDDVGRELGQQRPAGPGRADQAGERLVALQVADGVVDRGDGPVGVVQLDEGLAPVGGDDAQQLRYLRAGRVQPPDRPWAARVGPVGVREAGRQYECVAGRDDGGPVLDLAVPDPVDADDDDGLGRSFQATSAVVRSTWEVPGVGDEQPGRRRPAQGRRHERPGEHAQPLAGEPVGQQHGHTLDGPSNRPGISVESPMPPAGGRS